MPLPTGATVHVDGLAESLIQFAEEGPACLHGGDLGRRIAAAVEAEGGILTIDDLAAYRVHAPSPAACGERRLDTGNGSPAGRRGCRGGGGAPIMGNAGKQLGSDRRCPVRRGTGGGLRLPRRPVDREESPEQALTELLGASTTEELAGIGAASTIHVSAVDANGLACAATLSAGYGSGVLPPGTGVWLNNCLGELELNRRGVHALPPGTRLPSNMAPSVALDHAGRMMAVGTPGADRITSALRW